MSVAIHNPKCTPTNRNSYGVLGIIDSDCSRLNIATAEVPRVACTRSGTGDGVSAPVLVAIAGTLRAGFIRIRKRHGACRPRNSGSNGPGPSAIWHRYGDIFAMRVTLGCDMRPFPNAVLADGKEPTLPHGEATHS